MTMRPLAGSTCTARALEKSYSPKPLNSYKSQDTHCQRRFPTARSTKKTDALPGLKLEGHVMQDRRQFWRIFDDQILDRDEGIGVRAGRGRPVRRRPVRLDDCWGLLRQVEVLYHTFYGAADEVINIVSMV